MKKERRLGSRIFMGLIFLFLYAPILLMIVFSFNAGNSNVVWQGFSLRWYEQLFHDRAIIQSVYTTLLVSVLATAIATAAGTFAAVGFYSMRRRTRTMLMNVNNIPMMNADIVTGVSLCMLFVAVFGLWNEFAVNYRVIINFFGTKYRITFPELSLGFGTMLIAHITFNIPYVILSEAGSTPAKNSSPRLLKS